MLSTAVPASSPQPGLALSRGLSKSDPLKVLILDDERFDRHRLARMCSGFEVPIEVTNAQTLSAFVDTLVAGRINTDVLAGLGLAGGLGLRLGSILGWLSLYWAGP